MSSNNAVSTTVQTAKIITFPKERIQRNQTPEGFNEKLAEHKIEFISFMVGKHVDSLMNRLSMEGVDVGDAKSVADVVLIYEAVSSLLYRIYGLEHGLHVFTDANFTDEVENVIENIQNPDLEEVVDDDDGA